MTTYFVEDGAEPEIRRADRRDVEVIDTFSLSHNTRYFRFRFVKRAAGQPVGLPPGRHLRFTANVWDPETNTTLELSRSYTPIVEADRRPAGDAEFVIKIYPPMTENQTAGLFSRHMSSLKIGDRIQVTGPWGKIFYLSAGRFQHVADGHVTRHSHVTLVAGGAAITPVICLVRAFVAELDVGVVDGVKWFSLLYTNRRLEDILFREELEGYAREFPDNFRVIFTLTAEGQTLNGHQPAAVLPDEVLRWRSIAPTRQTNGTSTVITVTPSIGYRNGRIDREMLAETLAGASPADTLVIVRGRKEMRKIVEDLCTELNFFNVH